MLHDELAGSSYHHPGRDGERERTHDLTTDEARRFVAEKDPRNYFSTLYFDCLTHDVLSLELSGRRVGWDHVVLGSDYPFDMAATDPVAGVEALGLNEADMKMVLEGNASQFLRPLGGKPA